MEKISLKEYNTFHIDVDATDIQQIQHESQLESVYHNDPDSYYILGGGSNVLLLNDIRRKILKNELKGKKINNSNSEYTEIEVASGENWHKFVEWTLDQNIGGLENLSLIPGTVGAAPVQNIGAYGVEVKSFVHLVEGIDLSKGNKISFLNSECKFDYRNSIFKHEWKQHFFITKLIFRIPRKYDLQLDYGAIKEELQNKNINNPTARDVSKAVIHIRKSKLPDPDEIGNAGSFFKNSTIPKSHFDEIKKIYPNVPSYPVNDYEVKVPSGWLIETAGWKGFREGDAGCHQKQALVLINYGRASGQDIWQLAMNIIQDVDMKFGIKLQPEVNIWA